MRSRRFPEPHPACPRFYASVFLAVAAITCAFACAPAAALAHPHPDSLLDDPVYLPSSDRHARFDLLEPSYFISSWPPGGASDSSHGTNQVRFRVAVRYRMGDWSEEIKAIPGDWTVRLYFAFTQDAYWHLYDESAPFYDSNFMPESFVYLHQKSWKIATAFGVKHHSNGRDGEVSRGWNRYYATIGWGQPRINAFFGTVTAWKAWDISPENLDIKDYLGRGEFVLHFAPGALSTPSKWRSDQFEFIFRVPAGGKPFFPAFEGTCVFRFLKEQLFSPSAVIQYRGGVGPTIRDYNRTENVWRVGLAMAR